jgi:3-oxoacyl-[acyl-carrier protein] reductase
MTHDLHSRAALVTGAGVGIGRACAIALGQAGATVGVHYRSSVEEARETVRLVEQAGGRGVLLQADLTDEAAANRIGLLAGTLA